MRSLESDSQAMSESKQPNSKQPESKQLELLMQYTLFHIGIYITLIAGALALQHFKEAFRDSLTLKFGLVCFLVAGACGGVIASQIPNFRCWDDFERTKLGPWGLGWMNYEDWARAEHLLFWIGVAVPVIGLGFLW